ncbi:MAG: hypothetical protein WBM83_00565 [Flavobacteriaceae bacterium]
MKNAKQILGSLILAATLFTSCQEEENGETYVQLVSDQRATAQEFADKKASVLNNLKQEFQFNSNSMGNFTTEKGVNLLINGACLTKNGVSVTGIVDIEVVEIFDRAEMLTTNKATMGLMPNGDRAILKSGGEFFINATQNGEALQLTCAMQLSVPTNLTGDVDFGMTLWNGIIGLECDNEIGCDDVIWVEEHNDANEPNNVVVDDKNGTVAYYAPIQGFGWTNIDRFYNDPRPKTMILVDVPQGFDLENSAVYLSYDGEPSALARLDTYDEDEELFSEHYGQIPVGLECHLIFVSVENGNWLYAIKPATIIADGTFEILDAELVSGTEAQLTALINGLP